MQLRGVRGAPMRSLQVCYEAINKLLWFSHRTRLTHCLPRSRQTPEEATYVP